MSTRYVYEIYNTGVKETFVDSKSIIESTSNKYVGGWFCNKFSAKVAVDMLGSPIAFYEAVDGVSFGSVSTHPYQDVYEQYLYKYCILTANHGKNNNGNPVITESYLIRLHSTPPKLYWHGEIRGNYGNPSTHSVWNSDVSSAVYLPNDKAEKGSLGVTGGKIEKGTTLLGTRTTSSAGSSGAFYSNGWKWLSYKGSDTIDPTAASYSHEDLYSGESVTITITPRTPTYGGTISYQYQYSTDGGRTWTNIGSKTTDTSKSITILEGAEQFQARVLASDGWGFTSTTYVYGPSLPVSQIKAYATVGGKLAAGAKMYATMGGKIRQIQKGYTTVGGKIRKLF